MSSVPLDEPFFLSRKRLKYKVRGSLKDVGYYKAWSGEEKCAVGSMMGFSGG